MEKFRELLLQCPHHGFEMWRLAQILYEGLNYSTRTMVESMCAGQLSNKNARDAWNFLGDVAEKSMQWETVRALEVPIPTKGGIFPNFQGPDIDTKLSSVIRRLEALELRPTSKTVNEVSFQPCLTCLANDHPVENGPSDQANALFQKPRNDPFASTYNQEWRQ